ncbi:Helix-turn-helix [Seinonella peptonophila]|uniref:Helix-turn-helix n=1 Tax=Seinonella peptonophila TaxID=112248 RepID=A0A1M4X5G5_9BACL|nr:tetratricopeptide repeat protein [Seinonella peptonophila]SHE88748.1 Helix-turn-helix [Seinonella peptonophila]
MAEFYSYQYGEILRKLRNEQGRAMKFFEDDRLSQATISKIENGHPHVSEEKVKLYAERLGTNLEALPQILSEEQERHERIELKLLSVENYIDLLGPDIGLKKLKELQVNDDDRYKPILNYLKGKCYFHKKLLKKAKTFFLKTIMYINQESSFNHKNLKSICLNKLGRIANVENNLEEALNYTQEGIREFETDQKREYVLYSLMTNKAIYLEEMGLLERSLQTIQKIKEAQHGAKTMDGALSLFDLESRILNKNQMYSKAIALVKEGIELARINHMYDRSFALWNTFGNINFDMNKLDESKICYRTALDLKEKITKKRPIISVYKQLGIIAQRQGDIDLAKEYLEKSIQYGDKIRDMLQFIGAFIAYGDFYRKRLLFREASHQYQQGLELAQKYKYLEKEEEALAKLSECFKHLGNDEHYLDYSQQLQSVRVRLLDGGDG